MSRLRAQLIDLPWTPDLTLGQASQKDARIAAAIKQAMDQARVDHVDYLNDGVVEVHMKLELAALWDSLDSEP